MAGAGPYLPTSTREALETGALPGRFRADKSGFEFPTLRIPTRKGGAHLWKISVSFFLPSGVPAGFDPAACLGAVGSPDPDLGGAYAVVETDVRTEGNEAEAHKGRFPTQVDGGKNLKKKNATNSFTQALREAHSLYRKQASRIEGHAAKPAAGASRRAPVGFHPAEPPPMLVKKVGQTKPVRLEPGLFEREPGIFAQPKLNGVRLISYLAGPRGHASNGPALAADDAAETLVALYSRTSKPYPGCKHIRTALRGALLRAEEVAVETAGLRIDGELYKHGKPLEWISGQARRSGDDSTLEYWIYDVFRVAGGEVLPDPAEARQALLDRLATLFPVGGPLVRTPNIFLRSVEETEALSRRFLNEAYEGLIVRRPGKLYEPGLNNYHSASLFKIKPLRDAEFTIVGFGTGSRGKAKNALMWVAQVPEAEAKDPTDRTFRVTPKDVSDDRRRWLVECLKQAVGVDADGAPLIRFVRDFYGKPLTVEFPSRSAKTGKPEQAKALAVRTYEGDADDPMKRLERECGPGPD